MTIDAFLADLHKIAEPSVCIGGEHSSPNVLAAFRDGGCFNRVIMKKGVNGSELHFDLNNGEIVAQTIYNAAGQPTSKPIFFSNN